MAGFTETGYLKIILDVSVMGPMPKAEADKIKLELMDFFKERMLNVHGKMQYVSISEQEIKKNYQNLDTSV